MIKSRLLAGAITMALVVGIRIAQADTVETFFGSINNSGNGGNNPNTAQAVFDFNSTTDILTVTLTALSAPVLVPTDVLTGLFFNVAAGTLTNQSVALGTGSTSLQPTGVTDLTPYWAAGSTSAQGQNFAITATGDTSLGHSNFGGAGNNTALQGISGGAVDGIANGANGGVTGGGTLFDNSVVFTFSTTSSFSLDNLNTVVFQYGTSLSEPSVSAGCGNTCVNLSSVSEASTVDFLAADSGLAVLLGGFYCLRRKRGVADASVAEPGTSANGVWFGLELNYTR
jgi:hypothetical protein